MKSLFSLSEQERQDLEKLLAQNLKNVRSRFGSLNIPFRALGPNPLC